jgi:hypothetical protein
MAVKRQDDPVPAWWWFPVGVVVFGLAAGHLIKGGGNPRLWIRDVGLVM